MKRKKDITPVSGSPKMPLEKAKEPKPVLTPEEREKAKQDRMYFNANTQAAIVAFQIADKAGDRKERDRLYVTGILPAFEKLVENLINIHKFSSMYDSYDDLKNDCVNFLYETLHKFDPTRGTNAFSYYNVCCKNFLIIRTKQKSQRIKRSVSLDDVDSLSQNELHIIEDHNTIPGQDTVLDREDDVREVINVLHEIRNQVKTPNELTCINSIITIFENIDDLDLLNKSAILLYLRELSGLSPKQLTTTLQTIKRSYRTFKIDPELFFSGAE
jgi:hypothetical protein